MKKKDAAEPDSKRRRKSTKTDHVDKDSADGNPSVSKSGRHGEGTSPSQMKKLAKSAATKGNLATNADIKEVSVIELETKEAEGREMLDDVESYKNTCTQIESLVSEIDHLKAEGEKYNSSQIVERRIKATLLTTSLKKLNRLSLIKSKNAKEKTQEMKQKVDVLHLDLQNLLYEVMHMKKEIQKCTEFTSKDEEINLVDVETFYKDAPTEISKPQLTKNDSHQQMLARLEWELDQRKKLSSMKDQLFQEKGSMEKDISSQIDVLTSLKPSLNGILKATIPLQEKLGLNIDARRAQYDIASYLPKPLYVLYVQINAYSEATEENDTTVVIEGDHQTAKALFESGNVEQDDYEDSDPEDTNEAGDKEENKRRKHKKDKEKARLEEKRRSILRKHPLEINVKIKCQEEVFICMTFSYLTALHIVTVSTTLDFAKEKLFPVQSISSLLSPDSTLMNLFDEEDDGEDSPNPSSKYQLEKLGLQDFSQYISEVGRPYHWAQRVAGLSYLPKHSGQRPTTTEASHSQNIESVVKRIKSRIASRFSLQGQLSELEKLIIPESKCAGQLFPLSTKTKLVQWKCVTYSEVTEMPFTGDFIEENLLKENDIFYYALFRREQEEVEAAISIGVSYPWQPPLFALALKQRQEKPGHNFAKELERELNLNFHELTQIDQPNMLLTNQLHKLAVCVDVLCETNQSGMNQGRIYMRKQRGRDRSRPYTYIHEKGLFVHEIALKM